jgi:flavodoxin
MRALVVYESASESTGTIAEHIAAGLARWMDVDLAEVANAPNCIGEHVELLVVGGCAHPHSPSHPTTRTAAPDRGLREWLNTIHKGLGPVHAAAFDTSSANTPDSAARTAENHLRRNGFHITEPARTFHAEQPNGPLRPAEAQRAQRWAERLGAKLATNHR